MTPLDDVIDWTVSYRQDSTIFRPYCYVIKKDTEIGNFMNNYTGRFSPLNSEINSRLETRSTLISDNAPLKSNRVVKIIWFVSNCNSASRREDFVQRLSEEDNIQIDVFGSCGSLRCDRSLGKQCYEQLLPKYDFYLSLENEICPDYFTEKLCSVLKFDIVPIVLGGANYDRFAPPNSVINAADFTDVGELAKYLRLLVESRRSYERFFEWKQSHSVEFRLTPIFGCDLCTKLNEEQNFGPEPKKFSDWWNQRQCLAPWKL